jgi:hypothetical protein
LVVFVSQSAHARASDTVTISPVYAATYHDCNCYTKYSYDSVSVSRFEVGELNYSTTLIHAPVSSAKLELLTSGYSLFGDRIDIRGSNGFYDSISIGDLPQIGLLTIYIDVTSIFKSTPGIPEYVSFDLRSRISAGVGPNYSSGTFATRSPLVVTMVPEPSTAALLIIGCVVALAASRLNSPSPERL